jgi:hypothetical protein
MSGPTPTTIARPWEAPTPPGSPRPRYRHPSMSGAGPRRGRPAPTTIARPCQAPTLAGFAPPLPPSSPRRRGSRLTSTKMDGRPDARGAVSAIAGGPGCAAFFVGGRTWIPASAGMTVERVCGGRPRGRPDRGAGCAVACGVERRSGGPMVPLSAAHVGGCPCHVWLHPATVTRPCEAPAPPGSPAPATVTRPCRAPTLAGVAPPPPPSPAHVRRRPSPGSLHPYHRHPRGGGDPPSRWSGRVRRCLGVRCSLAGEQGGSPPSRG